MHWRRLVVAFVLVPLLVLGGLPASAGSTPVLAKGGPGGLVYVELLGSNHLQALDAGTLNDVPGNAGLKFAPWKLRSRFSWIVTNAVGTAYAAISFPTTDWRVGRANDLMVRTFTAAGARRSPAFHPAAVIQPDGLTADGTELYGLEYRLGRTKARLTGFDLLSAVDGHLIDHLPLQGICCPVHSYDAATQRLYLLDEPLNAAGNGPGRPDLRAFDVATGRQVQELALPSVRAGFWTHGTGSGDGLMIEDWSPGFALSPDGRQLAILDGNTDRLTTIDALTLRVARTVTLARAASPLEALGRWLGIVPTVAEAKELKGVVLQLRYSPDGKSLLVTGTEGTPDAQGMYVQTPLPLRLIDAATGRIMAEEKTAGMVSDAQFALDGSAIYALRSGTGPGSGNLEVVRYDPATLQPQASRSFDQVGVMGMFVLAGE
jgi:DNA-binding beta-propeller fold protein YncE